MSEFQFPILYFSLSSLIQPVSPTLTVMYGPT